MKITVPGSKSITNRAILAAGLAAGHSVLENALVSDDTRYMKNALTKLGVKMAERKNELHLYGGSWKKSRTPLFCGNAGTAVRFLAAVLASQPFASIITGDSRMCERPIQDLTQALIQLGATVKFLKKRGFPPVKICGPLKGGRCEIKGTVSSQFLSGLLFAAPLAEKDVTIVIKGDLVSKPYLETTLAVLKNFGIQVRRKGYAQFSVKAGQRYLPTTMAVEGDASAAGYFWAISGLTGEKIEVTNVAKNSRQADAEFLRTLKKLSPTINGQNFPDAAMTLAVFLAFQKGKFHLTGLANLRVKECDRLKALTTELSRIGCRVEELRDGLRIWGDPKKLHSARIKTYGDHRMAMSFAVAGFVLPGLRIQNPGCVTKTYPHFWKDIRALKKAFQQKNVVLTGMRGSGKSELGAALGRRLGRRFIDLDEVVEKIAKKPVAAIVAAQGWPAFRAMERKAVKKIAAEHGIIVATGGGTIMDHENANLLKKNGTIIYLSASLPSLKKRLAKKTDRPSLSGNKHFLAELSDVLKKRQPMYAKMADKIVEVSYHTPHKKRDLQRKTDELVAAMATLGLL